MPPSPQNPNPNFDFMLKNDQPAKRGLAMPNLPKPLKIGLAIIAGLIILIIISSLLSSRKSGGTQPMLGVLARGQETLRVTALVQHQLPLQDPQTQALAATLNSALTSDQAQLVSYLAKNHTKVSKLQLAADTDKTTDAALQTASQNNGLDSAYVSYLRDALAKYQADLQSAYKSSGPTGKSLLQTAFDSSKTLLTTPPLRSS